MFRHKGKHRTYIHNLRLASMLSFIAGLVNITGVLSIKTLTTNITGHFAYFAEELINEKYINSLLFLLYIIFFLLGAFFSTILTETVLRIKPRISHTAPMIIEILILLFVAFLGRDTETLLHNSQLIACSLLFAMGIQNSLVTQVSQSSVRTTHLTGLFTDLGIELAQLFFYRKSSEVKKLTQSVNLRLIIITFFFAGCILGGFAYTYFKLKTLLLAAICLSIALSYDTIRYRYYTLKRKLRL